MFQDPFFRTHRLRDAASQGRLVQGMALQKNAWSEGRIIRDFFFEETHIGDKITLHRLIQSWTGHAKVGTFQTSIFNYLFFQLPPLA